LKGADSCEAELTDANAVLLPTGLSQRYFTTLPAAKLLPEIVNVRFVESAGTDVKDNELIAGVAVTAIDNSLEQSVLVDDWQTFT
jgi:hypothetical protein